ncbi:hypothetical protein Tco_0195924 [Tanacetum coccineum]
MADLESCLAQMIAYLEKTERNVEFHEVIDFLQRSLFLMRSLAREGTEEKVESTAGQIEGTEDQTKEEIASQTPSSMTFGGWMKQLIDTLLLNHEEFLADKDQNRQSETDLNKNQLEIRDDVLLNACGETFKPFLSLKVLNSPCFCGEELGIVQDQQFLWILLMRSMEYSMFSIEIANNCLQLVVKLVPIVTYWSRVMADVNASFAFSRPMFFQVTSDLK